MLSVKLRLNSVVSTPGANFFTADIINFDLMKPLKRKEYVRLKLIYMLVDVVEHYNLKKKATKDGYIFVTINHGMYRLPQSGLLAQELLKVRLVKRGYYQGE